MDGSGALLFRLGEVGGFDMKVRELVSPQRVHWEVIDGPAGWVGTTVAFDLTQDGEVGDIPDEPDGAGRTGAGAPHRDDVQISNWPGKLKPGLSIAAPPEENRAMTDGLDIQDFNRQVIEAFRASGGVGSLGPVHFDSLVLLTTTGRRSGRPRTVPLGSCRDAAGDLLLFASNMGSPTDPDWLRNIRADPHVVVEVTGRTGETVAEVLDGEARDDAYRRWIEAAPHVADHQAKAGRVIPMVRIPAT